MFPQIRDIEDALGSRLRLSLETHASGTVVAIERPDHRDGPRALLDRHGSELLRDYIEAARLALPHELPDERADGDFPIHLRLRREPSVALLATRADKDRPLAIPATFWDRLHAELGLMDAHASGLAEKRQPSPSAKRQRHRVVK